MFPIATLPCTPAIPQDLSSSVQCQVSLGWGAAWAVCLAHGHSFVASLASPGLPASTCVIAPAWPSALRGSCSLDSGDFSALPCPLFSACLLSPPQMLVGGREGASQHLRAALDCWNPSPSQCPLPDLPKPAAVAVTDLILLGAPLPCLPTTRLHCTVGPAVHKLTPWHRTPFLVCTTCPVDS